MISAINLTVGSFNFLDFAPVDAFVNEEFLGLNGHHLAGDGQEQEEQREHENDGN